MNSHHLHPDCTYTRQSLPLYSGGDLSRAALARVEAHVRQCKSCASLTQRAQEARRVLVLGVQVRAEGPVPSLLPQIQASPTVTPALVMPQPAKSRLRLVRWTAAAAAAGVLGFLALRVPQVAPQVAPPVVSQAVPNPTVPNPTAPNPTTGLIIAVPSEKVRDCDLTVEEGTKMLVSAGLVTPSRPLSVGPERA